MDAFIPYNQTPNPNLRLNKLLLILIFTFLASGGVLVVLKQVDSYWREQIYFQTQAALPVHKINKSQPVKTPALQANITNASTWQVYKNSKYGFELKYPKDWQQSFEGLSGTDPTHYFNFKPIDINSNYPPRDYEVIIYDTKENNFDSWFNKQYQGQPIALVPEKTAIKLNNLIDAWQISEPQLKDGCNGSSIMVFRPGFVIKLPDPGCIGLDVVTQISSTFKFFR